MARSVIEEKLESLRRCLYRLEAKRPDQLQQLVTDIDLQDIITLNLTRAIQICVDIAAHLLAAQDHAPPTTMAEAFEQLAALAIIDDALMQKMRKSVGFRNVAIHGYEKIDLAIVYNIIHRNLDDFKHYAKAVDAHVFNS